MLPVIPTVDLPAITCGCNDTEEVAFDVFGDIQCFTLVGEHLHVYKDPNQMEWPEIMRCNAFNGAPWIIVRCGKCNRCTFHVHLPVGIWATIPPTRWRSRYQFSWPEGLPVAELSMNNIYSILYVHHRERIGVHFAYHPVTERRCSPEAMVGEFFQAYRAGWKRNALLYFKAMHLNASVCGVAEHRKTLTAWNDLANFAKASAEAILKHKDACNSPDLQKAREALVLKLRSQGFYPDVQPIDEVIAEPGNTTGC